MPSPTSSTRPTSRVSSCWRYWSISLVRTERISLVLILDMATPLDQSFLDVLQPRPPRAAEQPVADAHHQAAQQRRVNPRRQDGLLLVLLAQLVQQPLALVVGQRYSAGHDDAHPADPFVVQLLDRPVDATQQVESQVVV